MLKLATLLLLCCFITYAQQNPTCLANWTYFPKSNKCFKAFGGPFDGISPTTWSVAGEYCNRFNGGHLASIHSDDEATFLVELSRQAIIHDDRVYSPMWLGLSYSGSYEWQWTDGSEFTYQKWWDGDFIANDDNARAFPAGMLYTKRVWSGTMFFAAYDQVLPFACQLPPINEG